MIMVRVTLGLGIQLRGVLCIEPCCAIGQSPTPASCPAIGQSPTEKNNAHANARTHTLAPTTRAQQCHINLSRIQPHIIIISLWMTCSGSPRVRESDDDTIVRTCCF